MFSGGSRGRVAAEGAERRMCEAKELNAMKEPGMLALRGAGLRTNPLQKVEALLLKKCLR